MTKCICPICNKEFGNLNMHVVYAHNLTCEEFHKKYPGVRMQQPTQSNKVYSICPYCGKEYNTKNGLGTHIAYKHKNVKYGKKLNINKTCKEGYICPICGRETTNISQHVLLTHNLTWDKFVKDYNWTGMKKYVSEEAHKNLSMNKKKFYESERGTKLKQIQSKKMSGTNNIVYLPHVREKIMTKVASRGVNSLTGYGISIKLKNGIFLKSFNEFIVYSVLEDMNINFKYEEVQIRYKYKRKWHTYFADFIIDNHIYELKPYTMIKIKTNNYNSAEKYNIIKDYANKAGYEFELVNPTLLLKKYNYDYSGGRQSMKKQRDILYEYMKAGKIECIHINKGVSKIKTFLEKEQRWEEFNNIIITHKEI